MPDNSPSSTDINADATHLATDRPTNHTPIARSHVSKKPENLEKLFVERFSKGDRVQVSNGRGVGPTIYTIESISDKEVVVRDDRGVLLPTTERKLKKVN